jgi:hypothetical protein
MRHLSVRLFGAFASMFLLASGNIAGALLPADAPSMSVHESCYGTSLRDGHRESIQGLEIRTVSYAEPRIPFEVQCFFLKGAKHDGLPTVDDTVILHVDTPVANLRVLANPIRVPGTVQPAKTPKARSSSGKRGSPATVRPQSAKAPQSSATASPREGFVVRVVRDGTVLRQHCSSHRLELLIRDHPDLLTAAAAGKKVRRPGAVDPAHSP